MSESTKLSKVNTLVVGLNVTNEGSGVIMLSEYASYIKAVSKHDVVIEYELIVKV
jgi:hypothetical protein